MRLATKIFDYISNELRRFDNFAGFNTTSANFLSVISAFWKLNAD